MVNQVAAVTRPHAAPAIKAHGFHLFWAEFNPLQYIPVVGTLYRAITGDTIPETARIAGSLVVSGLTGGPIGVALNVGITALEKLAGVDPEKIGASLIAFVPHPPHPAAAPIQTVAAPASLAFTPAQLAAYTGPATDKLNTMELARLV